MDFAQAFTDIGLVMAAAATFTKPTVDFLRPHLPAGRSPALTQLLALGVGIAWAFLLVLIVNPPWTVPVVAQTVAGGMLAGIAAIGITEAHKKSRAAEEPKGELLTVEQESAPIYEPAPPVNLAPQGSPASVDDVTPAPTPYVDITADEWEMIEEYRAEYTSEPSG